MYRDLLGIRFTPHGRTKEEGFDCYGLAIEVLKRNGIHLADQWNETNYFDTFKKIDRPEKNCIVSIVFAEKYSHIGVYIGEGYIIHTTESTGVLLEPLWHYKNKIKGFYNVES